MKKLLSIVLSLVMLCSVSVATVNAFAEGGVGSIETTTTQNKIVLEVNGKASADVSYEKDPENPKKITFTYDGDGELIGWEFPGMREGVDYEILREKGNDITILVAPTYRDTVTANAIVREPSSRKPTETTKKNDKEKSPKTGAASAAGIAAMGAGAAILTALKKKEDAE
ncbi:MAG: hypothetical protein IKS12_00525 [Eubacterium sp.]|nr:hypothetical protein [Eubacterium sp.]MBR7072273.1 hypothetical protein [Eubacterium sp.]